MVSSSICGSCAAHSGWMLAVADSAREPGDVIGVHHLQVRQVMPLAVSPSRRCGRASTASSALRTARSPRAWKCTWKPSRSSAVT